MNKFYLSAGLTLAFMTSSFAQTSPFAGRWDLTMQPQTGSAYPQWLELVEKNGVIEGRYQPRGGAARPVISTKADGNHLILTLSAARGSAVTWDLTASGDKINGVEKLGDAAGPRVVGVRAPELKRPMPKAWGKPKAIFSGKDITGWEPMSTAPNKWVARNGELVNDNPEVEGQGNSRAANLKTIAKFQDFKLHIEVNCPEHGNSGIYLRGRYELQVGTEGGTMPSHEMGAVYGHFAPASPGKKLGEWTTFDITFVGRYLTVVRDGVKIHDNVEIPGPTGGALDSNESEPGPFFLQGDHHGVIRYRNITVQEPKK